MRSCALMSVMGRSSAKLRRSPLTRTGARGRPRQCPTQITEGKVDDPLLSVSVAPEAEEREPEILERQVLAHLTPDERSLCFWKQLGFSSRDIAREEECPSPV
jgi:DNA-directed RNA polymerase specialized sigma24 family protein